MIYLNKTKTDNNVNNTIKCLKYSKCKRKCLKENNTRYNHRKYSDIDYPHPFPFNYFFIHNLSCPLTTQLYVYIISECKQIRERNAVRLTWGKKTEFVTIRYIIGIGNKACEENYFLENKLYRDIMQINIYESFANETLFNLYTMKYLNVLCPYSKLYAKFDLDCYVDFNFLFKEIKIYNNLSHQFFGAEKQKWMKVNGDPLYKYSSPKSIAQYYNSIFPKSGIYVYSGFATVFTSDLPSLIFNNSLNYPLLLRIDDQYISWILYKLNISINRISSYEIVNDCRIYKRVSVIHRIISHDMIPYSQYYYSIHPFMNNNDYL